jgi:hypothetical protein
MYEKLWQVGIMDDELRALKLSFDAAVDALEPGWQLQPNE